MFVFYLMLVFSCVRARVYVSLHVCIAVYVTSTSLCVCVCAVAGGPTAGPAIHKTMKAQNADGQMLVIRAFSYPIVVQPSCWAV